MSTLAEIEAAIPTLSTEELAELEKVVREQRGKRSSEPRVASRNLWSGARERLLRIWGDRVLSEQEVAALRDDEDGE